MGSAVAVLAACSGSGDVASSGSTGDVIINPPSQGGGGSGGSTQPDGSIDFVGAGCPDSTSEAVTTVNGVDINACVVSGTITQDTRLIAGNTYLLDGNVFVGTDAGPDASNPLAGSAQATLTIEAGAVIAGRNGEDALVVSRGSQLVANGSATQPIIFTSSIDLLDADQGADADDFTATQAASDGESGGSTTARGQWGGIVINGRAPINDCQDSAAAPGTDACEKDGEGGSGLFGGSTTNDNSGTLSYVRVQYAGFLFSTEDELNGIAFQGVGNGTTVSNIQVHNNADDGVEFFGGSVNARNIVITGAGDDSIDWTDGWTGSLQYAVVVQTEGDANRGIEGDNRGGDNGIAPQSNPSLANLTFITNFDGDAPDGADDGIKVREGTAGMIANAIVVGYVGDGFDYDVPGDFSAAFPNEGPEGRPTLVSSFVAENGSPFDGDGAAIFNASGAGNVAAAGSTLNGLFSGDEEQAVAAADLSANPFFDNVDYIGAFADDVQDIAQSWLDGWTLETPFPASGDLGCPAGTTESDTAVPAGRSEARVCTLPPVIASDMTLTRGNLYELDGSTFIGTDAGPDPENPLAASRQVSLTVDPGVTLFGLNGEDALVVTRGSQLFSNGTATSPVVMTSLQDLQGTATATSRGQWGGLVINGRAPINDCQDASVDPTTDPLECEKDGEGGSGLFGGNDPADDSGNLSYTRIQYAGFLFSTEDELNGIAFQGVGSGTDVDYIQVHNNSDDGVEFFGGTVNAKHVVITGAGDDSIDWTDGWQGNIQYAIVKQTAGDANRAIEGDNRGGDNGIEPQSMPWIANFTFVTDFGGDVPDGADDGIKVREGTGGRLSNGVVVNYVGDGFDFDTPADFSGSWPTAGDPPSLLSTYVAGNGSAADSDGAAIFNAAGAGNVAGTDATLLSDSDGTGVPLLLNAEAEAVTAADTARPGTDFFDDVDYIGAVDGDADNWYVGWTFGL